MCCCCPLLVTTVFSFSAVDCSGDGNKTQWLALKKKKTTCTPQGLEMPIVYFGSEQSIRLDMDLSSQEGYSLLTLLHLTL